jgi:pimeloyl-ACP methyl ester carboxylesterase
VAIGFAAKHPKRVPQLVIVESGPELCVAGVERIDADERSAARTYRSVEEYATVLTERYQFSSPQIASRLAAPALRRRPDGLYELKRDPSFELDPAKPQRGVTRRDGRMIHEGLWRALGRIRCPTLVLRGVVSSMLPRDVAQRMVDEVLARGELAEIPLAGHAVMLDNPTGLRDALTAFLRAHGS